MNGSLPVAISTTEVMTKAAASARTGASSVSSTRSTEKRFIGCHRPRGVVVVLRVYDGLARLVLRGTGAGHGRRPVRVLQVAGGGAGHGRAQLLGGDRGRIGVGDQAAPVHDPQRVGEADQLVEVGGDQQDRQPLAAGLADLVPDLRLRADVDAARRVGGDEQLGVVAHLAADDQLLLVAAGERGGGHVDAGRAHVVLGDDPLGVAAGRARVEEGTLGVGGLGDVAEDAVLPERGVQEQAVAVAVLGDVADAALAALPGRGARDVLAVQAQGAPGRLAHAHDGLDQFGLAVALDSRRCP